MKSRISFCLLVWCAIFTVSYAQVPASQDTITIPGDIPHTTLHHAAALESTINGDTTGTGARINPNRVYALQEGHFYYQNSAINVMNPNGTLTIVGVPDSAGTTKPVILMQPTGTTDVPASKVYGSIKMVNIHYQVMEVDGNLQSELFYCGTANKAPQSLTIDNCLFEFSDTDIFDCTNETGAIGGWPYGAKFFITNSYFRNMFEPGQWWGSRIFQCKHPIDTLWVENNTIVGGGLTFLQQNALTDFAYFNHNTIVNNKKYWLLSLFYRTYFVTNNIFINQNWVGEDTNETVNGSDPRKEYQSTIDIDSVNANEGVKVQPKYYVGDPFHYSPLLALNKLQVYVSNNVNYYDPLLTNGYYQSPTYILADTGNPPVVYNAIPSYLGWFYPGVQKVENIPGEWMNTRTKALFTAYAPPNGGFIEDHTSTNDPKMTTPGIADASVVVQMAIWNQHQYNDPRFPVAPDIVHSKYIFGDYDPTTIPGRDNSGNKTENGSGITKFTDLTENFSQSSIISTNDGFPVGSLIWDDTKNAIYAGAHAGEWAKILQAYLVTGIPSVVVQAEPGVVSVFSLAQNYPNPFNPSTKIQFSLPQQSFVQLKIYNTLGQEVATPVSGKLTAGRHSINFNGRNLASGLYVYRITAGNFTSVKKMMLLK